MGIKGKAGDWVCGHLLNRKQCTLANGATSREELLYYGVWQGSMLGPLLFLIYRNDLKKWLETEHLLLYADDTVVYTTSKSPEELEATLNKTLSKLNEWCQINKITIIAHKNQKQGCSVPGTPKT